MTAHRLPLTLACAWTLVFAGLFPAVAQFPPPPGQSGAVASQSSPFPPPPGQSGPPGGGFGPPPGKSGPPGGGFGPPPGQGGFSGGGFPPQGGPPSVCMSFPTLRDSTQQSALAIRAAGERNAPREEVCGLFKNFTAKEAKLIKFLVDNSSTCGVPPDVITTAKTNHAKSMEIRKAVCSARPAAPAGPSLSDALGGPIIADDASTKQPGRGTFDTLTGNALKR
jgi:hypothetical protein